VGVIFGHLGASHQDGRDIIPPFVYNGVTYSQNWDAAGQAVFAAGCVVEGTTIVNTTTTTMPTTTTTIPEGKASICHATGSATNPFVLIGPSPVGVIFGHLGASHQGGRDIIPPFVYNGVTYSQNWDAAGQAIFAAGCVVEATTIVTTTTIPTTTTIANPDVTLCHATGAETNPYTKVTVSADEAYNVHYLTHPDDIIPPSTFNGTPFQLNWDLDHQATYTNNCVPPLGTTIVNTTTTTEATTTTTMPVTTTTQPEATTTTAQVLPTLLTQPGGVGQPHHSNPVLPRRNPPDRVLPFTGSDPSPFLGIAGVLMALGASLVLASRRRRSY
jgi:LPXTG-motif cell wall-anchored protein